MHDKFTCVSMYRCIKPGDIAITFTPRSCRVVLIHSGFISEYLSFVRDGIASHLVCSDVFSSRSLNV